MCKDSVQGYRLLLILATDQGFFQGGGQFAYAHGWCVMDNLL